MSTVFAWSDANPDQISYRFHNMLLTLPQHDMGRLIRLLQLFAMPAPAGRGKYQHHDGWRT